MQIKLNLESTPFNLYYTLNCGQVFRWEKKDNFWYGIVGETVIKLKQDHDDLIFQTFSEMGVDFIRNYFRLDDDIPWIISKIDKDTIIRRAINEFYGLRIIRQDPWECLISYICATFSNISRIKAIIRNLSLKFGREISYDGLKFYTFPPREALAKATIGELLDCRLGFRSKYVQSTSRTINDYKFDLKSLKRLPYMEAKRRLLTLPGVGPKVADCVLLFSLDKLEAFPIDIWIERVLFKYYSQHLTDVFHKKGVTTRRYSEISAFGRRYFGDYAGYAQQYLFYYYRLHSHEKRFKKKLSSCSKKVSSTKAYLTNSVL